MTDQIEQQEETTQNEALAVAVSTPPVLETHGALKENFGSIEKVPQHEVQASAMAAQATAQVQARYIMALKRPRDVDTFRQNLLKDCRRPGFAELAEFSKPMGGRNIIGPSIRLVEAALRHYGNVLPEKEVLFDDAAKRVIRCTVTDLETNVGWPVAVTVAKTVERSQPRKGLDGKETWVSARYNSANRLVYEVEATEDELLNKENAQTSKALRTSGLRILPADIIEEAIELCRKTKRDQAAKDPDGERRKIADAFANINVPVAELKEYLGHDLAQASPIELDGLRKVYTAVKDGEVPWVDLLAAIRAEREEAGMLKSSSDKLKEKLKK